jgi:hypothetical protein
MQLEDSSKTGHQRCIKGWQQPRSSDQIILHCCYIWVCLGLCVFSTAKDLKLEQCINIVFCIKLGWEHIIYYKGDGDMAVINTDILTVSMLSRDRKGCGTWPSHWMTKNLHPRNGGQSAQFRHKRLKNGMQNDAKWTKLNKELVWPVITKNLCKR